MIDDRQKKADVLLDSAKNHLFYYSKSVVALLRFVTLIWNYSINIYITDLETSVFFKNNGDETFTDIAALTGTEFNSTAWGAIFLDGDNDADLDLYVSGTDVNTPNRISAAFYENIGPNNFQIPSNAGFQDDDRFSYSNAIGDLNNDGLVDFVVTNSNDQNVFYLEK